MATKGPKNPTPRVPIQTPMFNEAETQAFTISRTWVIFFEKLFRGQGEGGKGKGPFQRTLLLKDTTIGNDIADHVTVWGTDGKIRLVTGVLRKVITSDLTVRVKIDGVTLGTFTIPHATAIDTPIEFTTFAAAAVDVALEQVFSWDVTASDGQKAAAGVASFTVSWEP